jgi:hypothetical protein
MLRHAWVAWLVLAVGGTASAADLTRIDRRIGKEPAYTSKSPRYALLLLGPEAKDRVWLVKDGNVLYVDRNGNGDLTEPGEKLVAKKGGSAEEGCQFEADELTVGGKKHSRLRVSVEPLKRWMFGQYASRPEAKAILARDPGAEALQLTLEMEAPHLKAKGRALIVAGVFDVNGPLTMAAKAADAPIIHCGGPLQVTFWAARPTLRRNRPTQFTLVVGTPGLGAGTLAMLGYDETIPASNHPTALVAYPPAKAGTAAVKKLYELKERC